MQISWRKKLSRKIRGAFRAKVLSHYGEGIVARTRNGVLVVDPRDFNVSRSLLKHGSYDWAEINWLGRVLNKQSQLVVVGAHIGSVLIPLLLQSGSRQAVALEPSPRNFCFLNMNLALNGLATTTALQLAAGASEGRVRFTENRINSGNSRISQSGEVEVELTKLDSVLSHLSTIDLLLMDTEGFEVAAMRGAQSTLAKTNYFYVEYAPEQLREQGVNPTDFVEVVAQQFPSMYIPGKPVQYFENKNYVSYLNGLPERRGLLLNLLFSKQTSAVAELLREPG